MLATLMCSHVFGTKFNFIIAIISKLMWSSICPKSWFLIAAFNKYVAELIKQHMIYQYTVLFSL